MINFSDNESRPLGSSCLFLGSMTNIVSHFPLHLPPPNMLPLHLPPPNLIPVYLPPPNLIPLHLPSPDLDPLNMPHPRVASPEIAPISTLTGPRPLTLHFSVPCSSLSSISSPNPSIDTGQAPCTPSSPGPPSPPPSSSSSSSFVVIVTGLIHLGFFFFGLSATEP